MFGFLPARYSLAEEIEKKNKIIKKITKDYRIKKEKNARKSYGEIIKHSLLPIAKKKSYERKMKDKYQKLIRNVIFPEFLEKKKEILLI